MSAPLAGEPPGDGGGRGTKPGQQRLEQPDPQPADASLTAAERYGVVDVVEMLERIANALEGIEAQLGNGFVRVHVLESWEHGS
jgi:hypothetical protein